MEKITKKSPKLRTVTTVEETGEYYEYHVYVTEDGEEFDDIHDAQTHENRIRLGKIKHLDNLSLSMPDAYRWWKAETEEELEFLKQMLPEPWNDVTGIETLKVGEWFTVNIMDGGDYRGEEEYITLSEIKRRWKRFIENIENA